MVAALIFLSAGVTVAAPVLLISVDGLKPEYVLKADVHSLKIPYLRRLLSEGTYAEGVVGVWPTVTYPSHTTIVTGVMPAEHGIIANIEFDPLHQFKESWFWYAHQIRVPTLWSAAHAAGLGTASIGWPVTVGDANIDYLIPEYWRISGPPEALNASDRYLIDALSQPAGLLEKMRGSTGGYLKGNDTSLQADTIKTKFAIDIIRKHTPVFMTLHLSSMDDAQHAHGAFSEFATEDLEAIDSLLSQLADAARASNSTSIVAIVSDHGFTALTHRVSLNVAFRQAGLLEEVGDLDADAGKVTAWKAQAWVAGGMAAIMLRDQADRETEDIVRALLKRLATDPKNGIAAIKERAEIKKIGAYPQAAFLVVFEPGFYAGGKSTGSLVSEMPGMHGGHGFSPELPVMRSSFFLVGATIAHHRNLGVIDMRQIAPTIAKLIGVRLPTATATALHVAP